MEFVRFLGKLPTPSTIFYLDPPVYDEAAAVLDEGLHRPELIRLSLKQIRALGVHTKLIKVIKVETSVNNPVVAETIQVCKKLLHHLNAWIGSLNASYAKDYIPILHDIYSELPSNVVVPGLVWTFDVFSKLFIQNSLVMLLNAWAENLRDYPADALDSIMFLTLVVDPSCLKSYKVIAAVNRLLLAVEVSKSFGCVQMYKVLHYVCVATKNLDKFKVTLTKNFADLQLNLRAYVTRWLDVEVPIEEEQIFGHHWILDYLSVMQPGFRRDLALQLIPSLTFGLADALELQIRNKDSALEDSVNFFEYVIRRRLNLTSGIIVRLDPDAERAYGFGVSVDWFYTVSKDLLDLHNLFEVRNENLPNAYYFTEIQDSSKLRYYTFAGMLVGLALTYSTQIAFSFSNCLHVLLADKEIELEVLQEADHNLYSCFLQMLSTSSPDLFLLTVLSKGDSSSEHSSVEQKLKCINRYLQSMYVDVMEDKLNCFKEGLDVVLGTSCRILIFNLLKFSDLETLLCGSNELSVDDWERFVVYGGPYTADHAAIVLFWQIVREMTPRERLSLFTYWTSFRRLPIGGVGQMPRSLQIISMQGIDIGLPDREAIDLLPVARTCFFQLRLPEYSSPDIMRSCLRTIANSDLICGSFGFE